MADCPVPYYCTTYTDYPQGGGCEDGGRNRYFGGGSELWLLKCGAPEVEDPEDETEIQGLIDAGWFVRLTDIKGGMDEPSAVEVDDVAACGGTITATYDRTMTWQDGKVSKTVVEWYNDAKLKPFAGAFLKECADGQDRWNFVDQPVTLTSSRTMPNTSSELQVINGTISWKGLYDPVPFDMPDVTWPE